MMRLLLGGLALVFGCHPQAKIASPPAPGATSQSQLETTTNKAAAKPAPPLDAAFGTSAPATIALGRRFACAIRDDQRVACWGDNRQGQLGQGHAQARSGAVVVPQLQGVLEVAAGSQHACARRQDGSVWCWGRGSAFLLGRALEAGPHGVLRVPDVEHAVAISVGPTHSCAVLRGGSLRCWGSPRRGKLGLDHLDHVTEPSNVKLDVEGVTGVAVGRDTTCVRDERGAAHCWGVGPRNDANQRMTMPTLGDVVAIQASGARTCARSKQEAWSCWSKDGDVAPLSDPPKQALAIALGDAFGCALGSEGVSCWGHGAPIEMSRNVSVAPGIGGADHAGAPTSYGLKGAVELRALGGNVCARGSSGDVFCWGRNGHGELGRAPGGVYATPVEVPFAGKARVLAVNAMRSCSIGNDRSLRCWGTGFGRQPTKRHDRLKRVTSVSLAPQHSCAVHAGGKVACWGSTGAGELGKERVRKIRPKSRRAKRARGGGVLGALGSWDARAESLGFGGLRRPYFVKQVAGLPAARSVAVQPQRSCALTRTGVWCWGEDGKRGRRHGAFGSHSPCSVLGAGDLVACKRAQTPRLIRDSRGARAVGAGPARGFCMLRSDGQVACWRRDEKAALVQGVSGAVSLHQGADETCAITRVGKLFCWRSKFRAVEDDNFGSNIVSWSGGRGFSCAATKAGSVLCRGAGKRGQLGNGQRSNVLGKAQAVKGVDDAVEVKLGRCHGCARLSDGQVKCWGEGDEHMAREDSKLLRSTKPLRVVLGGS